MKASPSLVRPCPAVGPQGKTREDALVNIREAIQLWLESAEEDVLREAETNSATRAEVLV